MPWLIAKEGNVTAHFSADTTLSTHHALNLVTAETVIRLAKAIDECYSYCVEKDGACPTCFLISVSLRLEGEGWEIMQSLSDGECNHNGCR